MSFYETDPEFMERFAHFAYNEVVHEENQQLDGKTRYMAILATLIGNTEWQMRNKLLMEYITELFQKNQ